MDESSKEEIVNRIGEFMDELDFCDCGNATSGTYAYSKVALLDELRGILEEFLD